MSKTLTDADIAVMDALMESSPDKTELRLPTWLFRRYLEFRVRKEKIKILKHLVRQDKYTNRDIYARKLISDLESES